MPLALLLLMAVVFVLTLRADAVWLGYVHAFSEAAMVGALADWFAVTALFRHPLGIPIPHTAIVKRRKDEIGASMARFVADNFLIPDAIRTKLQQADLARLISRWLADDSARDQLAETLGGFSAWLARSAGEEEVQDFLLRLGQRQLDALPVARLAGSTLKVLTRDQRHQGLITELLRYVLVLVHDNRELVRGRVREESPWWLPGFVDDAILKKMLDRIETLLLEMSLDEEHELRQGLDRWLDEVATSLETDEELASQVARMLHNLLDHPRLKRYWVEVWQSLAERLEQQAGDPGSELRRALDGFLQNLVSELQTDHAMRLRINEWVERAAVAVISRYRHAIASLISDTVATWDADDTSRRVELAIGRDLQFIRINGTLVGGLVGLVLHALVQIAS